MRILLSTLALTAVLFAQRADACTPPCRTQDVTLGAQVLPSTAPAIPLSGSIDAANTVTLIGPDGGVVPSTLDSNTLTPDAPLESNAHYAVELTGLHCRGVTTTATESFQTTAASPLPTAPLGTVTASEQKVGQPYASMYCTGCSSDPLTGCDTCGIQIFAATRTISLEIDTETLPFAQVVDTTLKVDGVPYAGTRGFTDGKVVLPVVSRCLRDARVPTRNDLEPGAHTGTLEVHLIGGTTRTSQPFNFTLDCADTCVKPNASCGLPDQLCDEVPDAGADAGAPTTPTTPEGGCGGCSSGPSLLAMSALALIFRRRRVTSRVPPEA